VSLTKLRQEIDSINQEILQLLAKRMDLSKKVAIEKKKENLPIFDPEREEKQMKSILETAQQLGLSSFITEELFRLIVEYSKIVMQLETTHAS
jgi:chorismate mutase / prephenate dehydrogenase